MSDINAKFARAVSHAEAVTKSKTADLGKDFKYSYVTLNDVLESCKSATSMEGLSITQHVSPHGDDRQQIRTAIIDQNSGEMITFGGPVFPVTGDPQAAGSAITYHRRYSLVMLFALSVNDDDGAQANRAETRPHKRTPAEQTIRDGLETLDTEQKQVFARAFKDYFNSTLTNLPESKHGDALGFWVEWSTPLEQDAK
tara:strand:- start:6601 stop:7194 length:594 start_codon:yes stop_codon:yes gene_type:complete